MPDSPGDRLPAHGLDADAVLARLDEFSVDDRDWRGGRVFSLDYDAGPDVADLLIRSAGALRACIGAISGIALRGEPDATVLAFGGDGGPGGIDTFALGDALIERGGWFFDRQTPPDSLHAMVHAGHAAVVDELRSDLEATVAALERTGGRADDRSTTFGTV
ncbi:MAG: hypothetical protein ABSB09_09795 [Acidimicrobiales bacterium]|jgi:hypothetical protein